MQANKRLLSLDVFRGLTIAAMILVNNPGSWSTVYSPFLHADWHGCTPTDLIFPFFLFIVGVAIPFSLGKMIRNEVPGNLITRKIVIRSIIIFGLGLLLAAFPHFGIAPESRGTGMAMIHYIVMSLLLLTIMAKEIWTDYSKTLWWVVGGLALVMMVIGFGQYDFSSLRIPGVLQRIALVYLVCGLLFQHTSSRTQQIVFAVVLLGYWFLMTVVPVPGGIAPNLEPEQNLGAWLDRTLLGNHLWSQSKVWDPEGLLSTLPAIGTGLLGIFTGNLFKSNKEEPVKVSQLMVAGSVLIFFALLWDLAFPINKKLWTSSYVLYSGGIGMLMLGVVYWVVDIQESKWWIKPFRVFGTNAIFAYVLSGIFAKLCYSIKWNTGADETMTLGGWIYQNLFTSWLSPYNASLGYALMNVLVVYIATWFLYKNRVFIKV